MKLLSTSIAGTKLRVTRGASLYDCCREAAWLALERREIVRFTHNGHFYEANPNEINALVQGTRKEITK